MSRRTPPALAVASAVLLTGVLVGCATPVTGTSPSAPSSGSSGSSETVETGAAWLDGGSMIAVIVAGSSTCVPMADEVEYADGVLAVSLLDPPADAACTRDLVPRGIPVVVPEGVDPAEDLVVEVSGEGYSGAADLAGVAGLTPGAGLDEGVPSAGWASAGEFALLTWGSSSCPPQIDSAVVSAPGEIAVSVATPPGDQVCTADFGPRVNVVAVDGAEAGVAYEAVLTGDSFEGTRVAVAGTP